ncbi:Solute carrier family 10 member 6 [Eumeta japonica]|uniref:Solute carrier family 10 member 6 n=1 Tax=Eumeta variegata TaxID=151549 RepID=A0A4C1VM60_EUMVA|nr:Solute carrier family 10 member 6 [Eumeta japonica]
MRQHCAFGLGYLIFRGDSLTAAALRLGLFFTGVCPGGGASNIWTFALGGNLNLSLAMTTISTLAAFAPEGVYLKKGCPVLSRGTRAHAPGVLELLSVPVTTPSRDGSILLPYLSHPKTSISL